MNNSFFVVLLAVACLSPCEAWSFPRPSWTKFPTPIDINLNKYSGLWYEIAASYIPKLTFERGLDCNTAVYVLEKDTTGAPFVNITNTGRERKTGNPSFVNGAAVPLEDVSESGDTVGRLKVGFGGDMPEKSGSGNYLVVYLGKDYSTAVVTDPYKTTLFFLSRSPTVSDEEYERMKQAAKDNGHILFFTGLIKTPQDADTCKRSPIKIPGVDGGDMVIGAQY